MWGTRLIVQIVMHLTLPADGRLLPGTRRAVAGYLEALDLDEEQMHDVVLAVDEACANVIRHAFPGAAGRFRLRAEVVATQVDLEVEDDGVGFDAMAPRRQAGVWDTSGRGLHIIRQLMTSVELESPTEQGGTRVLMQRDRSAPVVGAGAVAAAG